MKEYLIKVKNLRKNKIEIIRQYDLILREEQELLDICYIDEKEKIEEIRKRKWEPETEYEEEQKMYEEIFNKHMNEDRTELFNKCKEKTKKNIEYCKEVKRREWEESIDNPENFSKYYSF